MAVQQIADKLKEVKQKLRVTDAELANSRQAEAASLVRIAQLEKDTARLLEDKVRLEQDKAALVRQKEAEAQKMQARHKDELTAEQKRHCQGTADMEKASKQKLEQQAAEHKAAVERLEKRNEDEINLIRKVYRNESDELSARNAEKIRQLEQELAETQRELELCQKGHESEMHRVLKMVDLLEDPQMSISIQLPSGALQRPMTAGPASDPRQSELSRVEVERLETESRRLQGELTTVKSENQRLKEQLRQLEERIKLEQPVRPAAPSAESEQLRQRVEQLQKQLRNNQELTEKMKLSHEATLDLARKDAEAGAGKLRSVQEQLDRANERLASLQGECRRLLEVQDEQKRAAAGGDTLRNQLQEGQERERRLQASLKELTERVNSQAKGQDERTAEWKRKEDEIHRKLCDEAEKRKAAEQELLRNRQALANAQRTEDELTKRLANAQGTEDELKRRLANAQGTEDELKRRLANAQRTEDELKKRQEQLKESLRRSDQKAKDAQREKEEAIRAAQQLRHYLQENEQSSRGQNDAAIQQINQEKAQLRVRCDDAEARVARLADRERQQQAQIADCEKNLAELQKRLRDSEESEQIYRTTAENYAKDFAQERAEKEQYKARCDKLQADLNDQIGEMARQHQEQPSQPFFKKHQN